MYTFLIISYNEEPYVLQALESIRYQIEQYGEKRNYQLVIADDCSKDRTQELIEFWLKKYGHIFSRIDRIYQSSNVGTCKNVSDALEMIEGEFFFSVAGDDLLACTDIFSVLESNKDIDVLASQSLILKNGSIVRNRHVYADSLAQVFYNTTYISWAVGLGCPIQSGAAWSKRLNTMNVLEYMRKFRLLDDRTRYYAVWRYERPVSYKYISVPFLIYRKNERSVSNISGRHVSSLNDDLQFFFRMSRKMSENRWYKFCAFMQEKSMRIRGGKIFSFIRYFTPYYFSEQFKRLVYQKKMKTTFAEFAATYINTNQQFVEMIEKRAERIYREYENTVI